MVSTLVGRFTDVWFRGYGEAVHGLRTAPHTLSEESMNPKRLLAAVAGAAMLSPIPIAMTTTAAEAATTVDTRVVINKTSSVYTYKTAITISGQVQGKQDRKSTRLNSSH